ncbi:MAG: LysM peptidoglycan-binding domain-containing protein [Candidatus Omnitrophica bacterium]|nr:LysM peptidoglycan-binding domain-containing protein [Candidatus Omnitrophota bacterium]
MRKNIFLILILSLLIGCTLRTYSVVKERVDQDLCGNRGYLKGSAPLPKERKTTRTTQVIELELFPPIKFEKLHPEKKLEEKEDKKLWGNLGYIERKKVVLQEAQKPPTKTRIEKYTIQKNDTLQKISKKFYGTTKYWQRIYEANRSILKDPNSIYPGQVINIPLEELKEPKSDLK